MPCITRYTVQLLHQRASLICAEKARRRHCSRQHAVHLHARAAGRWSWRREPLPLSTRTRYSEARGMQPHACPNCTSLGSTCTPPLDRSITMTAPCLPPSPPHLPRHRKHSPHHLPSPLPSQGPIAGRPRYPCRKIRKQTSASQSSCVRYSYSQAQQHPRQHPLSRRSPCDRNLGRANTGPTRWEARG
jgi:hypothetical protein